MIAAIAIVAVTHTAKLDIASVQTSQATAAVQEISRHKRHLLHLAHLRYLAWQRQHDAEPDGDSDDPARATVAVHSYSPGAYSCHALEAIWEAAGGNYWAAFIAAEIARAESGGKSWAISPTADYGLWQINASHGSLATLDPYGNARAAVLISGNGSDWYPWTTYVSGAYIGQCLGACRLTSYGAWA